MGKKPEIKVFEPYFWCFLLSLRNYFTIKLPQKLTFGRYSLALLRYQSFGHEIWPYLCQNMAKLIELKISFIMRYHTYIVEKHLFGAKFGHILAQIWSNLMAKGLISQ